jgi:hypothetical protein
MVKTTKKFRGLESRKQSLKDLAISKGYTQKFEKAIEDALVSNNISRKSSICKENDQVFTRRKKNKPERLVNDKSINPKKSTTIENKIIQNLDRLGKLNFNVSNNTQ